MVAIILRLTSRCSSFQIKDIDEGRPAFLNIRPRLIHSISALKIVDADYVPQLSTHFIDRCHFVREKLI